MSEKVAAAKDRRGRVVWLAVCLGLVTTILLAVGHRQVGYVRDEGIYFVAGRSYADWVVDAVAGRSNARTQVARDRAFAINREHPALMKTVAGLSAKLLAEPVYDPKAGAAGPATGGGVLPLMPEGAAMRLPAQALAGFSVGLLFLLGVRIGRSFAAGLLAAGAWIALPRVWFHAGLHCFDIPVAVVGLVCTLVYYKSLRNWRYGLALGPLLGLAIAVKHNALFLPFLFGLHHLICLCIELWRCPDLRRRQTWLRACSLPFVSMALLGPLTALALWPWMWADTWNRINQYFAFHLHHSWYNMEFLGVNFNKPPLPIHYPVVLTWATVPTCLLLLAGVGLVWVLRRDVVAARRLGSADTSGTCAAPSLRRLWSQPHEGFTFGGEGCLLTLSGVFPLVLISLPGVPIFGGTKHWLVGYPFFALAAAYAWRQLWTVANLGRRWQAAPALMLVVVLVPGFWSTVHGHPHNLSQYAPAVGGARGAASLGLGRGFWGHSVTPFLDELRQAHNSKLYLHDLHELVRQQYVREGRLPATLQRAPASRAQRALLFYERHMLTNEIGIWDALHTTAPSAVVTLDDVPLTGMYVRPH